MSFNRDLEAANKDRKTHDGVRPVWNGPIPDRYYYMIKNKRHSKMNAWVVLFSDVEPYGWFIRQIAVVQGGHWSLVESDVPLPEGPECVKRAHGKVEGIKEKLFRSHPQAGLTLDVDWRRASLPAIPVSEDEVFG